MKNLILTIFILSFSLLSSAQSIQGLWKLQGQDPKRGTYSGVMEIRANTQGSLDIIRAVNYDTFKYRGYFIQELWTGVGEQKGNSLSVNFLIKKADFLKSVNGTTRDPNDFKTPIPINKTFVFNNNIGSSDSETLSSPAALEPQPIWVNQRQVTYTQGTYLPSPVKLVWDAKIKPVIDWYRNLPETTPYRDQPDYKSGAQYVVLDPTDFEFYKTHPHFLRVINKQIDTISLVETLGRRNAYAPSLIQKANHYDLDIQKLHINSLGMISYSLHDAQGKFTDFAEDGDGGLWTGMYAGSQAMRYLTTHEPIALENFKKSLNGILLMVEVTGLPNQFARTVRPLLPNQTLPQGWNPGVAPYQNIAWMPNGNNDMYKGLVHGLIWGYLIIPRTETVLWQRMTAVSQRLVGMDVAKTIMNSSPALGLAALFTRNAVYQEQYIRAYLNSSTQSGLIDAESGLYYGGVVDSSGVNLGMMSSLNDILISQTMARDYHYKAPWYKPYDERDIFKDATSGLMKAWNNYSSLRRDMLTIAGNAFAANFTDFSKVGISPAVWQQMLPLSLWGLREIPIVRNEYNIEFDFSLRPDWCLSAWPFLPWKSVNEKQAFAYHKQGVQNYPSFEGLGYGSNMHWKEKIFLSELSFSNTLRSSGADYLFTYWMARFSGLINENTL